MRPLPSRLTAATLGLLVAFAAFAPAALASSPEDWAKAYCKTGPKVTDALNDTADNERALAEAIRTSGSDVATLVEKYDSELAKAARLAKKTAKALKKVGAPDVKNGDRLNSAGIKAYKTVGKELAAARAALADIDPANPAGATDPLFALADALGNAASALNDFGFDSLSPAVEKSKDLALAVGSAC